MVSTLVFLVDIGSRVIVDHRNPGFVSYCDKRKKHIDFGGDGSVGSCR